MAMSVTYTTIGGVIVHEALSGNRERELTADPLGSLVKIRTSVFGYSYSAEYWPYGEIQTQTGSNPTRWAFVGLLGYMRDLATMFYVRARYYRSAQTRWMTVDPLWPVEDAYLYVGSTPACHTDRSGAGPWKCERCAWLLGGLYWFTEIHWCCHRYIHCLVCCILNHEFGEKCAVDMQNSQSGDEKQKKNRMRACRNGIKGNVPTSECHNHCKRIYPECSANKNCPNPPREPSWPRGGMLPPDCYNCSPLIQITPVWPSLFPIPAFLPGG
jgi:RHS repeat-associated protein